MGTVIHFPNHKFHHHATLGNSGNHTLAEAICNEIGVPADGNCIALRLGRRSFFSNAQAIAIWLTESIDHGTFDDPDVFGLTDVLANLLNEHLKKWRQC